MSEENKSVKKGFLGSMSNDSIAKTLIVTVSLCFVCAIVVSFAAVTLKDKQIVNALNDKRANILEVAGIDDTSVSIDERFQQIESRLVDLDTGEYVEEGFDVEAYDQRQASKDKQLSEALPKSDDIAGIKRRANIAKIYLVKDENGEVSKYVFPVHGYGLWSTMYGFVSLESDLNTIYRLKFYDQKETAGLGGEVENPDWRKLWEGKKLLDPNGAYKLFVGRSPSVAPEHHIDGLAGATLTTRGVHNLFEFWMNDLGFGPYLDNVRQPQS